jgi:NAD(P)-dependent dehydrogenase (short-subunit alcohol dehydrogenase family)
MLELFYTRSTAFVKDPTKANTSIMSLHGQTALITGGGKNLGAQIAREIANEGVNLALHYNSPNSKDETLRFKDELMKAHKNIKVSVHAGDLTTGAAVEKLFKDAVAEHGKLNIVINTVGMVLKKPMTDVSEAEYDTMFA